MDLRIGQTMRLDQKMIMTPQLQLAIRLLQLSRLELIDAVREEMTSNPYLEDAGDVPESERIATERAETPTIDQVAAIDERRDASPTSQEDRAAIQESSQGDYWEKVLEQFANQAPMPSSTRGTSEELPSLEATLTGRTSLSEHIEAQVRLSNFTEVEQRFAMMVANNLDENGYLNLRMTARDEPVVEGAEPAAAVEEVEEEEEPDEEKERALALEDLAREAGLDPEDAEEVLRLIQQLDPVGVAARDLRECLLAQAEFFGYDHEDLEWQVIDRHLHNVERRNFNAIVKDLKCELEDVYTAAKFIQHLEPRPGRNFVTEDPPYITPDVYVFKVSDEYVVSTNDDGMPKLKINEQQARALLKDPKAKAFVNDKLNAARWFVRSIEQRQKTIVKVTRCIVEKQRDFFEKGIQFLKPMILRDVAESVGMHESTISRVTTNKYVHTPRGIFELKYFFNSAIRRVSEEDIASEAVKQAIKKIVAAEDPRNPYSDEQIVKLLKEQSGIDIARRTVAKYREMLGILASIKRKQYY